MTVRVNILPLHTYYGQAPHSAHVGWNLHSSRGAWPSFSILRLRHRTARSRPCERSSNILSPTRPSIHASRSSGSVTEIFTFLDITYRFSVWRPKAIYVSKSMAVTVGNEPTLTDSTSMRAVRAYARSLIGRKCKDLTGAKVSSHSTPEGPGGITHDSKGEGSKNILGSARVGWGDRTHLRAGKVPA